MEKPKKLYSVSLTEEEIGQLGELLNLAVKQAGLTGNVARAALHYVDKLTAIIDKPTNIGDPTGSKPEDKKKTK